MDICTYELDEDLGFACANEAWDRFARANDAPGLLLPGPVGKPIDSFIGGDSTSYLFGLLYAAVRRSGKAVRVPIRCDAPSLRRFLEVSIEPRRPSGFRIHSRLLRSEPREPVALLDSNQPRDERLVRMCSFCKCVETPAGWLEVEAAMKALKLFERERLPAITHGVCAPCLARTTDALDALDARES